MHIRHKVPLLLVGPSGTGKSFYMQKMLMHNLDLDKFSPAFLTFTSSISANLTQVTATVLNKAVLSPNFHL